MIKKYLLGLFVFIGLGLSFCSSWEYVPCTYVDVGTTRSGDCIKAIAGETVGLSNYTITLNGGNISFYDVLSGVKYTGIFARSRTYYGKILSRIVYNNGTYYGMVADMTSSNPDNYKYVSGPAFSCISTGYNDCMWNSTSFFTIYQQNDLSQFQGLNYDYVILPYTQQSTTSLAYGNCFHFPDLNKYLCFPSMQYQGASYDQYGRTGTTASLFEHTKSMYFPFGSTYTPGLGDGGIELNSDESALNYYEKTYGWDESICYVGVDNVTTLYGTNGVSFQQGKGLSIFDTFNAIYGNKDLDKVYVWLNSWLLNYEQWFGLGPSYGNSTVGNPSYLAYYNASGNRVDLYYDNLTFPFANKPVAFYFMASNIEDQSVYYTMGSSVVSYCNIKINSGTYDQIIDSADKNNITNYTEQHNKNNGLNPDGTNIEHDGYFGSGVNIAFSGNTSIKNALKNFFDTIDNSINISEGTSNGHILPTWLLSAFMFVILFKFLRKK